MGDPGERECDGQISGDWQERHFIKELPLKAQNLLPDKFLPTLFYKSLKSWQKQEFQILYQDTILLNLLFTLFH